MATDRKLKNPGGDTHAEFDREINVRGIVYTGVGLAAVTAAAFIGMWFLFRGLSSYEERRDPAPLPIPEAAQALRPVGPMLQATPERELEQLLAIENEMLGSYGVAEGGTHARVPIERAMEMVLAQGLGTTAAENEPTDVAAGEVAGEEEDSPAELAPETEPTAAERDERPALDIPDESEGPPDESEGPDGE